jgi:hypothetical protein
MHEFEILDNINSNAESLLTDPTFDFLDPNSKPISIFRITKTDFFVCHDGNFQVVNQKTLDFM